MTALITIKNLSCERDERTLFSGLSVEFNRGEILQIAGPNGAGKTTFLKCLTGLSGLHDGEILWKGQKLDKYDFQSSVLYLGHLPGVKKSLTALENLQWYFGLNGIKDEKIETCGLPTTSDLEMALTEVGLKGYQSVPCSQMSAGQHRRVGLARLYCSKAPVWILDEPFTAIDVKGVAKLEALIQEHAKQGGVVIMTTHQALSINNVRIIDLGAYRGGNA